MELLDRLLAALDVEVDAFAICEVCQGWRLRFDPAHVPTAHYGLMGAGMLILSDGRKLSFARDTLVLLPPHSGYSFELPEGSRRERRIASELPLPVDDHLIIRAGDGDVGFAVACGRIRASYAGIVDLFNHLNAPVVESFAGSGSLRGKFQALLAELAAPTIGTRVLASTLLKQCLVLLLRRQSREGNETVPWLSSLGDRRLAQAILVMLDRPAEPHTLDRLARIAGMSRSAFAERFAAVFERPPIEFLKEVRLRRAARLLETTDLPVKSVASSVGYSSRSYFSRAFKKLHGVGPKSFRAMVSKRGAGKE